MASHIHIQKELQREGYKFLGWSEDKDATDGNIENLDIDFVDRKVDYYAIWIQELGVKYPGLAAEIYELGDTVTLKDTFDAKKGYTLEGWTETEGASEVDFELGATIESIDRAYALYPVYLPIDCDITVGDNTDTVKYDSEYTLPETFEDKEGYTFVGFTATGENYKEKYDKGESFIVKGSVSFSPLYEANKYEVKVGDNDSTFEEYGSEYTLPMEYDINDDTQVFIGYKDQDGNIYNPGDKFNVPDKNMTFTIETRDKEKYVVKFFDGKEEYVDIRINNVVENTKITAPADPEKIGHTFNGWFADAEYDDEFDFETPIIKDTNIYAKFEVNEYTLKIGTNETKVKFGAECSLPDKYDVEYTKVFEGFKDENGEMYGLSYKFDMPDHDVSFDVIIRDKAKYEVHFYDGATEYDELALLNVYEGETIELPTVSKTDNDFGGWYLEETFKNKFDSANTIEKSMDLYAKFEVSSFTVSIEGQKTQTVKKGTIVTLPSSFTVSDKTKKFVGWIDQDNKTYSASAKVTINKNMTFKTNIINKSYHTAYFYNGSSYYTSVTVYEGEKLNKPSSSPTKSNAEFSCWTTSSGSQYTFGKALTSDINLYAKFINKYTVTTYYLTSAVDGSFSWNTDRRTYTEGATYSVPYVVSVTNGNVSHSLTQTNGNRVVYQTYTYRGITSTDMYSNYWRYGDYTSGSANLSTSFSVYSDTNVYAVYSAQKTFVKKFWLGNEKEKDDAKKALTDKGYTVIAKDLNDDTGGNWVFLGYTTTTNPNHAVKNLTAWINDGSYSHTADDGAYYTMIGNSDHRDLNKGSGKNTDYIRLSQTYDIAGGAPIIKDEVKVEYNKGFEVSGNEKEENSVKYVVCQNDRYSKSTTKSIFMINYTTYTYYGKRLLQTNRTTSHGTPTYIRIRN